MIVFYTLVWGEEYRNLFLNYVLPQVVSSIGNIHRENEDIKYIIETTDNDKRAMEKNLFIQNLNYFEFKIIEPKDAIQSFLHERSRAIVEETIGKYLTFIAPDVIYIGLENVWKNMQGKKAACIATAALRVLPSDLDIYLNLKVYPRIDIMHPETECHMITSDHFYCGPVQIIFPDYEVRAFASQPLFVKADKYELFDKQEFDYLYKCVPNFDDIYVVKDCNECCELSITKGDRDGWMRSNQRNTFKVENLCNFMKTVLDVKFNSHMVKFFEHGYNVSGKNMEIVNNVLEEIKK